MSCFHRLRNLLVLKFGLYFEATSKLIFFFWNRCLRGYFVQKTLIQISSFRAATRTFRDTVKFPSGRWKTKQSRNHYDRGQASNAERTEVKWRFSELLSDGSQICLKTSEITRTNLTIWNDRTCRWAQIWKICSYYEVAGECKFIRYCMNQNTTVNLLLKVIIKSTPRNLQTATPRVHFASIEE